MTPKYKSSNVENSGMPKRNCKVLPLSKMLKVLDLVGKILYTEIVKIYGKNKSPIHEIVKKKFILVLLLYLKLHKLWFFVKLERP